MAFGFGTDFSIDRFKSYFEGGARSYLFLYEPSVKLNMPNSKFFVRSSSIPQTSIEDNTIEYQQLQFKMGGRKVFEDWVVSFNVDRYAEIRTKFENWMNKVHEVRDDMMMHHYIDDYKSTETFKMLDLDCDTVILNVKLVDTWPKSVGPIVMDYSNQDFAQFDVTFSYLYHKITNR